MFVLGMKRLAIGGETINRNECCFDNKLDGCVMYLTKYSLVELTRRIVLMQFRRVIGSIIAFIIQNRPTTHFQRINTCSNVTQPTVAMSMYSLNVAGVTETSE